MVPSTISYVVFSFLLSSLMYLFCLRATSVTEYYLEKITIRWRRKWFFSHFLFSFFLFDCLVNRYPCLLRHASSYSIYIRTVRPYSQVSIKQADWVNRAGYYKRTEFSEKKLLENTEMVFKNAKIAKRAGSPNRDPESTAQWRPMYRYFQKIKRKWPDWFQIRLTLIERQEMFKLIHFWYTIHMYAIENRL